MSKNNTINTVNVENDRLSFDGVQSAHCAFASVKLAVAIMAPKDAAALTSRESKEGDDSPDRDENVRRRVANWLPHHEGTLGSNAFGILVTITIDALKERAKLARKSGERKPRDNARLEALEEAVARNTAGIEANRLALTVLFEAVLAKKRNVEAMREAFEEHKRIWKNLRSDETASIEAREAARKNREESGKVLAMATAEAEQAEAAVTAALAA
jgi:hypothetical protein